MTNEQPDRADEIVARAARSYNEPGDVPREAMWERIAAARADSRFAPAAPRRRSPALWVWPTAAVLAAGLVGVGVLIGRRVERSTTRDTAPPGSAIAAKPGSTAARGDSLGGVRPPAALATNDAAAPGRSGPGAGDSTSPRARVGGGARVAYQLAVLNHLAGSEAMITSFRASARRGDVDAQLVQWSRDLLGETRMLESSPAADDPTMRRLLEDLELVISQIVRYGNQGTHRAEDLDLIERSIDHRAVLTKLRSAASSSLPSGT